MRMTGQPAVASNSGVLYSDLWADRFSQRQTCLEKSIPNRQAQARCMDTVSLQAISLPIHSEPCACLNAGIGTGVQDQLAEAEGERERESIL